MILLAGATEDSFIREVEIVKLSKQNTFLAVIPVVLFHPDPDENILFAAYQAGADEFIHGDWKNKLIEVRIRLDASRVLKGNSCILTGSWLAGT